MPSKYTRKKDRPSVPEAVQETENAIGDRELFLKAFEKPTQIYRYLKLREKYSPIFLNRNLTFMKKRTSSSKSAGRRRNFRPDDLLEIIVASRKVRLFGPDKGYLNLFFFEFDANQGKDRSNACVSIDVSLIKVLYRKRKDGEAVVKEFAGQATINRASSGDGKNVISLKADWFVEDNGYLVKAYKIKFNVTTGPSPNGSNGCHSPSSGHSVMKKRRQPNGINGLNGNVDEIALTAELPLFDQRKGCVLEDGKYEVFLREEKPLVAANHKKRTAWHSSWEALPKDVIDSSLNALPVLRFEASWTHKPLDALAPPQLELADATTNGLAQLTRESFRMHAGTSSCSENSMASDVQAKAADSDLSACRPLRFHFLTGSHRYQLTTARNPRTCPWCITNCRDMYGLLKHIRLSHSRFKVFYTVSEDYDRIDVSVDENYDGSYDGNPHDLIGCAFRRTGPVCRTPMTQIWFGARRISRDLREFIESSESSGSAAGGPVLQHGHNRVYYHSITNQPVKPQELDYNSDDETDSAWLRQMTVKMINEFTDVNEGEKEIMKLWNLHVTASGCLADSQILGTCKTFVKLYGPAIRARRLVNNCKLHFVNLLDNGLLKASEVQQLIQTLDPVAPVDVAPAAEAHRRELTF